jgi:hypothetical protein
MGLGVSWERSMSALFSFAFNGIFVAFVIAAVIGHVLLIGALLRPFFAKPDLTPILLWHGRRAQPAR